LIFILFGELGFGVLVVYNLKR